MSDVKDIIDFEIPKLSPSIIMVTGVGGGGSNAVNHMFELEIADVSFMVCNTDPQALRNSPVPVKVRLGQNGLGAGNNPEKGRQAALESLDEIIEIYKREGTKMVFITAGMGGGTGTGAAPVIARAAKELGILTVAIVTLPFKTEGPKRMRQAQQGIEELRGCVDSLLLINNENIQEIFGKLTLTDFYDQLQKMKNMGSMEEMLGMLPGVDAKALAGAKIDEKQMAHTEAIIQSMTPKERDNPSIINYSRKKRIANGCGLSVEQVNKLLKQFEAMQKMTKQLTSMARSKGKKRRGFPGLGNFKLPF